MSQCALLQPRLAGTFELIVDGEHCQVYAVSIRIRRLNLIGGTSIAPRMELNFIALPVYQITNHPDACLQIWSNVINAKRTVEHTEGDTDNKIGISFCDGQANSCCNGFFNMSSDYTPSRCLKQKWILANMGIWLQVVITLHKGHINWSIDCSFSWRKHIIWIWPALPFVYPPSSKDIYDYIYYIQVKHSI